MTWGELGTVNEHQRYSREAPFESRKLCSCGCKQQATHLGMANGICLMTGCEETVKRWVRGAQVKQK